MDIFKNYQYIAYFIVKSHLNTCHLLKFSNMQLNTTLGILLTLYHTHGGCTPLTSRTARARQKNKNTFSKLHHQMNLLVLKKLEKVNKKNNKK